MLNAGAQIADAYLRLRGRRRLASRNEYVSKRAPAGFVEVGTQLGEEPDERGWASAYVIARKPA